MPDDGSENEYQRRLAAALMQTIYDQSLTEIDGQTVAYIRSLDAAGALVTCLSTMLESSPTCRTPKGMRETAEEVGKGLHRLMRDMRKLREEGHAPFNAQVIYTN